MQGLLDYTKEDSPQMVQLTTLEVYQQVLGPRIIVFGSLHDVKIQVKTSHQLVRVIPMITKVTLRFSIVFQYGDTVDEGVGDQSSDAYTT